MKKPEDNFYPFGLRGRQATIRPMARPHRHLEIEFFSAEDSPCTRTFNQHTTQYDSNECCIFWACFEHQLIDIAPPSKGFISYFPLGYFLSMELPPNFVQAILSGTNFKIQKTPAIQQAINLLKQWMPSAANSASSPPKPIDLILQGTLHLIAQETLQQNATLPAPGNHASPPKGVENVARMISYIAQHYQEPLKVKDICSNIHLNDNYARNLFSKVIGMTANEFLLKYRIDSAKYQLMYTNHEIIEIAMNCGFGSLSQFYSNFKRYTQNSPKQFRSDFHANNQQTQSIWV